MTKIIKFWKRFSFWTKVKLALIPLALGGEVAVHLSEMQVAWYFAPPIVSYALYLITNFVTDNNKDNIVDGLEDE